MRFRNIFMGVGGFLVFLILLLSDPQGGVIQSLPFGAGALSTVIILFTAVLYIGFLHLSRKALLDYIDLQGFFRKALETSEGSGLALVAVGIIMLSVANIIAAVVN